MATAKAATAKAMLLLLLLAFSASMATAARTQKPAMEGCRRDEASDEGCVARRALEANTDYVYEEPHHN
ncbi:hypothetical protein ACP4OV_011981 [Aristida adscensionis]